MPRGPRIVYRNALLNITSRGNNKRIIFKKEKDYKYFELLLLRYKSKYRFLIYHYCLMRNHLHLLLKIADSTTLCKAMQGIQLAYFHYFRRKYGYVGRFWQGRFYSKIVENDKYLLTAGLYSERNPVRAGFVNDPREYKWSSYNAYANGVKDLLVTFDPHYLSLGNNSNERQETYKEMMSSYLKMEKA